MSEPADAAPVRWRRRRLLRVVGLAAAAAIAGCGYRPRVHLDGGEDGIDEWSLGLPF
ncbi:MAG: hypothetical protein H6842_14450 [Rhodospirillaceae bacterium]|nr:hypothetical protein [Rhodospirillaceae bacterium]